MNDSQDEREKEVDSQLDLRKFAVLLAVIFVTILVIAALAGPVFDRIIVPVLGLDTKEDSEAGETSMDSTPAEMEFLPLLEQGDSSAPVDFIQHDVQAGETLIVIANKYGVRVEDIASANRLISLYQIDPGDALIIPVPAQESR